MLSLHTLILTGVSKSDLRIQEKSFFDSMEDLISKVNCLEG